MSGHAALDALAAACGVLPEFIDLWGQERVTPPDTKRALLRANGLAVDSDAMLEEALADLRQRDRTRIAPPEVVGVAGTPTIIETRGPVEWRVLLEEGGLHEGSAEGPITLPPLPDGVHDLVLSRPGQHQRVTLILAPARLPSVPSVTGQDRIWGVTAALYGLRSGRTAGLGDYEDLARLAETFGQVGAGFLGVNPVHNWGWATPEAISPYSPSHRGYLNTAHIAVDCVPGLDTHPEARRICAEVQGAAGQGALIDYAAATGAVRRALTKLYALFQSSAPAPAQAAFDRFRAAGGDGLDRFAQFEALSERHGGDWRDWPEALHDMSLPSVVSEAAPLAKRRAFHMWLQWVADHQLNAAQTRAQAAGMLPGLYLDLAVGPRRGGAETWSERDMVADGVSIGAPPDQLSPGGQAWALAAMSPVKLARTRYRGLRGILRRTMRHAGILRIDHVLGFNRSFWLPDDGSPGAYMRQPMQALLAITAIEAARAGTVVVGEDLGLVPPGFRESMAERGVYGYSVLQFEKDDNGRFRPPEDLRPQSLACFATHDTPTLNGYWSGADIGWWRRLGWGAADAGDDLIARRETEKQALLDAIGPTGGQDVFCRVHAALARSPAAMVAVQLDDLLGVTEAQNLPGTTDEHPNWRRRYETPVEAIAASANVRVAADLMQGAGRHLSTTIDCEDQP